MSVFVEHALVELAGLAQIAQLILAHRIALATAHVSLDFASAMLVGHRLTVQLTHAPITAHHLANPMEPVLVEFASASRMRDGLELTALPISVEGQVLETSVVVMEFVLKESAHVTRDGMARTARITLASHSAIVTDMERVLMESVCVTKAGSRLIAAKTRVQVIASENWAMVNVYVESASAHQDWVATIVGWMFVNSTAQIMEAANVVYAIVIKDSLANGARSMLAQWLHALVMEFARREHVHARKVGVVRNVMLTLAQITAH